VYYKLNSENANYYSVQNPLSYRLLSKNTMIKIYRTIKILSVILHVWNFVSENAERTQADGFGRQVSEEHIWDLSGRN